MMNNFKKSSPLDTDAVAGVHLAGANSNKSSIAIIRPSTNFCSFSVSKLYEKIGPLGRLFSDDRLVELLTQVTGLKEVFVDCPLTLPPCASCQLPVCPGALACGDPSVAMMLKASALLRRKSKKKARALNPQSHRLWDVWQLLAGEPRGEPSYSANQAPLVTRAMVFVRRLTAVRPDLVVRETSVPHALVALAAFANLPELASTSYRRFEDGVDERRVIFRALADAQILEISPVLEVRAVQSVEAFHAVIAALVAQFYKYGLVAGKPDGFTDRDGWVYVPEARTETHDLGKTQKPS